MQLLGTQCDCCSDSFIVFCSSMIILWGQPQEGHAYMRHPNLSGLISMWRICGSNPSFLQMMKRLTFSRLSLVTLQASGLYL